MRTPSRPPARPAMIPAPRPACAARTGQRSCVAPAPGRPRGPPRRSGYLVGARPGRNPPPGGPCSSRPRKHRRSPSWSRWRGPGAGPRRPGSNRRPSARANPPRRTRPPAEQSGLSSGFPAADQGHHSRRRLHLAHEPDATPGPFQERYGGKGTKYADPAWPDDLPVLGRTRPGGRPRLGGEVEDLQVRHAPAFVAHVAGHDGQALGFDLALAGWEEDVSPHARVPLPVKEGREYQPIAMRVRVNQEHRAAHAIQGNDVTLSAKVVHVQPAVIAPGDRKSVV